MTDFQAGYRAGFEAGKISAHRESVTVAMRRLRSAVPPDSPRTRTPLPPERRCDCGHADRTHNELGYCQARGRGNIEGCACVGFDNEFRSPNRTTP